MIAADRPKPVASPCVSVCVLLEPERICTGCFRTIDEICEWSVMDDDDKRRVLAALPARRVALGFADDENAGAKADR